MGIFANTGVSISVQDTLRKGRGDLDPLTDAISGWSHTSAAIGGYLTATCGVNASENFIDEWLENGLGRWLTLYDEGGNIRWRGFVDQVNANIAGLQIQRGPLTGITNRAHMVYSAVDTSTLPPTMGVRATTAQTNDTASQALFGIWQKVLSCGGTTAADAAVLQRLYLLEHAQPETTKTLSLGGGNLNMTLNLKGAWEWLKAYIANFPGVVDTVNLSARLIAILGLDIAINALFSTNTDHITTNLYQVKANSEDDKVAQKYILDLLTPGDGTAAGIRYTAGFYDNEVMYYAPVPSSLEYTFSLSNTAQEVTTLDGVTVRPWEVMPARWLQISDLMVGRVPDADLKDDPRNIFIESLSYQAPYGLTINGAKVGTLAQVLGSMGLSGLGN